MDKTPTILQKSIRRRAGFFLPAALTFFLLSSVGAGAVSLDKRLVHPRIFSPNGDGVNDMVYFEIDNPTLTEVRGFIYNVSGEKVADLRSAGSLPGLLPDSLVWDGRDAGGDRAPAGVYLYEVQGGGASINGTVVVVR